MTAKPCGEHRAVENGGMADNVTVRCFWRVLDRLDYWATQARLWAADVLRPHSPDCDVRD
jgi:hypothetical protein